MSTSMDGRKLLYNTIENMTRDKKRYNIKLLNV